MDIEEAAQTLSNDLFPGAEEHVEQSAQEAPEQQQEEQQEQQEQQPEIRPAPKSWAKETHELWTKLPPEAQAQIEKREQQMLEGIEQYKGDSGLGKQMREIIGPYEPMLRSQNIEPAKAVTYLMNAHYKLSTLTGQQKIDYFGQIAQTYGIDFAALTGKPAQEENPRVRELEEKIARLEGGLTQAQQRQFEEAKSKVTTEVNSFAEAKDEQGNSLHPYFDEVADDIVALLKTGASLQDAYDKAVWANPVTRAKEQARALKEHEAKLREQSTKEAKEAERTARSNVRSRDTKRSPTEPLGKMEDTMKETLESIRARAH